MNNRQEKPMLHFTPGDWNSYNNNLDTVTRKLNITSSNVRQESSQLRSSIDNTMKWKLKDTNQKLGDRISDVDQWRRNLDRTLRDVKSAIDRLSEAKGETERSVASNIPLLEAANECIGIRDRRGGVDLVEDEPYYELNKESELIQKINSSLRESASHAWDHLLELKEQRDLLESDLRDKNDTLRIDRTQLSLGPTDTHLTSLKPWPADACSAGRCPVSLETWLEHCLQRKRAAEGAVARAQRTEGAALALIRKARNDISQQREATQFALRKRRHETLQARDALAAQRQDLKDEISRLEREMLNMEQGHDGTRGNLKLVHTRLESRKARPGFELVRDMPTVGLEEELRHVTQSREYMQQKLRDIRHCGKTCETSQHHLHEVEDDLQRKERSLDIETRSLDMHENPPRSPYQTDIAWLAPTDRSQLANNILSPKDHEEYQLVD
ncbi:hypothetical protein JTE90_027482 [Oedothorax gibbosus]|uniref:Tektin n=1 Tax=Oedothorax gibbosus TaxID=931172 RepID=A0AAV6UET9_9ARAC|nr:hypothetical protein JTE90_027482 [Oedothorax gibbosus]